MYQREERYEFVYEKDGEKRICYPKSKEKVDENTKVANERGYKIVSITKLYPFSTEKNQHNFELLHNILYCDMVDGKNIDQDLYDKVEEFRGLPVPVAWLPYEKLKEAREISALAVNHRASACERAGRTDLIPYC